MKSIGVVIKAKVEKDLKPRDADGRSGGNTNKIQPGWTELVRMVDGGRAGGGRLITII